MISNTVYIGGTRYKWIDPFAKSDEWKAIESYANSNSLALPTDTTAFDQLIKDLKSAGIWQKLDVFYVFAGDGSNGFKLINWINPEEHYADAYGGLTWDLDGVKGNGINGYIDTNFSPSTSGVNFTLNNASIGGVAIVGLGDTSPRIIGSSGAHIVLTLNSSNSGVRINQGTNGINSSVNLIGSGFRSASRYSSTDLSIVSNSDEFLRTATSTAVSNNKAFVLLNFTAYGGNKVSNVFLGASLTYAETQSFRTIYNNFLTAIGLTPVA